MIDGLNKTELEHAAKRALAKIEAQKRTGCWKCGSAFAVYAYSTFTRMRCPHGHVDKFVPRGAE